MTEHVTIWVIAAIATAGVIGRPFGWAEWIWAAGGAGLLVAVGLMPPVAAWHGVLKGVDVYLFLVGMMALAEVARWAGLFDWLAGWAARAAGGSSMRLFALVYGVGTVVTVFLSNDATAVVLTPAIAAVARTAKVRDALPYLFICAFIANAASFVLPISNPANLVIYGSHMPPLLQWVPRFALPSLAAIAATYGVLLWTQRAALRGRLATEIEQPVLSGPARLAAGGIGVTVVVLMGASAFGLALGWPTFAAGVGTAVVVLVRSGGGAGAILRGISWGVLPLVAGLFVLVEALDRTGVTGAIAGALTAVVSRSAVQAGWVAGLVLGLGSNLVNNLPAGLLAGRVVELAQVPDRVRSAVLIGVDLGPNLSVTGSLATILWLTALRREGLQVGAWQFLKLGALVMPLALVLALAALFV